jgi:hypothetical protein
LTSAFEKIAGTKKIAAKRFFLQANAFFCSQTLFFAGNGFFRKKIAVNGNL